MIRKISRFIAIICCYHGNAVSDTFKKCVLHIFILRPMCVLSFRSIAQKLRKLFDPQDFPLTYCNNIPLPWQRSIRHIKKVCLEHLHRKTNMCAEFHEHWSKNKEVVQSAKFATDRQPDRPTDQPTADDTCSIYFGVNVIIIKDIFFYSIQSKMS